MKTTRSGLTAATQILCAIVGTTQSMRRTQVGNLPIQIRAGSQTTRPSHIGSLTRTVSPDTSIRVGNFTTIQTGTSFGTTIRIMRSLAVSWSTAIVAKRCSSAGPHSAETSSSGHLQLQPARGVGTTSGASGGSGGGRFGPAETIIQHFQVDPHVFEFYIDPNTFLGAIDGTDQSAPHDNIHVGPIHGQVTATPAIDPKAAMQAVRDAISGKPIVSPVNGVKIKGTLYYGPGTSTYPAPGRPKLQLQGLRPFQCSVDPTIDDPHRLSGGQLIPAGSREDFMARLQCHLCSVGRRTFCCRCRSQCRALLAKNQEGGLDTPVESSGNKQRRSRPCVIGFVRIRLELKPGDPERAGYAAAGT